MSSSAGGGGGGGNNRGGGAGGGRGGSCPLPSSPLSLDTDIYSEKKGSLKTSSTYSWKLKKKTESHINVSDHVTFTVHHVIHGPRPYQQIDL